LYLLPSFLSQPVPPPFLLFLNSSIWWSPLTRITRFLMNLLTWGPNFPSSAVDSALLYKKCVLGPPSFFSMFLSYPSSVVFLSSPFLSKTQNFFTCSPPSWFLVEGIYLLFFLFFFARNIGTQMHGRFTLFFSRSSGSIHSLVSIC